MSILWRRSLATAVLVTTAAAAGLLLAAPAGAATATSGTVAFSGDPGDFIAGGGSFSYTAGTDVINVNGSADGSTVFVGISGFNADNWNLEFDAPQDQALAPGTYTGATRWPFNDAGPGLSLSGNGRGCNTLTGSFTIENVVFGPHGYVQQFDATFEQHCEGGEPATRGEVHLVTPPAPPVLALGVEVAADGTAGSVNGKANVSGTLTCNKPATVTVFGDVVEVVSRKSLVTGTFQFQVACTPDAPVAWTASAAPSGTAPFLKGDAEVRTEVSAVDNDYGDIVVADNTTVVRLRRAR